MTSIPPSKLMDFTGRVVLVTGGSLGIGAALARRFAQAGASVAISYRSHADQAQELVRELRDLGTSALAVRLDQRDVSECAAAVRNVANSLGHLDILINNAGIYPHAEALEMSRDEWDAVVDVNLRGAFFCAQAAAREFIRQGTGGAIVNVTSINACNPLAGAAHYSVSKAGLAMLTRSLAAEWGGHGIRVNAVAPGLIDSPLLDAAVPGWRERYCARAPLGRIGTPEDVANVCLFLASSAASWITGQTVVVDGGVLCAPAF